MVRGDAVKRALSVRPSAMLVLLLVPLLWLVPPAQATDTELDQVENQIAKVQAELDKCERELGKLKNKYAGVRGEAKEDAEDEIEKKHAQLFTLSGELEKLQTRYDALTAPGIVGQTDEERARNKEEAKTWKRRKIKVGDELEAAWQEYFELYGGYEQFLADLKRS